MFQNKTFSLFAIYEVFLFLITGTQMTILCGARLPKDINKL